MLSPGADGVNAKVGRDVAIEQVELEVDEDRFLVLHLEAKPVEPALAFRGVFQVIDVVGRPVHVAAEPQFVCLLP